MKKMILFLVVLAVVGLVAYNFATTGEFSILPVTMSEDEKALKRLEDERSALKREFAQAGRSAGLAGIDTSTDAAAIQIAIDRVDQQIAELKKKIGK